RRDCGRCDNAYILMSALSQRPQLSQRGTPPRPRLPARWRKNQMTRRGRAISVNVMPHGHAAANARAHPPATPLAALWRLRGYLRPYLGRLTLLLAPPLPSPAPPPALPPLLQPL